MAKGTVKWFDPKKGFGFVVNDEGQDVFIHYTSIEKDGFRCLRNGQVVDYEQFDSGKGLQGRGVQIIETRPVTPPPPPKKPASAKRKTGSRKTGSKPRPRSRPRVINGNR